MPTMPMASGGQPLRMKGIVCCQSAGTAMLSSPMTPMLPVTRKTSATIKASASGLSLRQ